MRRSEPEKPSGDRTDPNAEAEAASLRSRLDALKADLGEAKAAEQPEGQQGKPGGESPLGVAMRAGTELVAGVLVGGAMGYFLDRQLGTKPWLMVILLIMGMAAGFRNLYRLGTRPTSGGNEPRK